MLPLSVGVRLRREHGQDGACPSKSWVSKTRGRGSFKSVG